jgi:hypothetical protein
MRTGYLGCQEQFAPALARQQREADAQASRWIERELVGLMQGRTPFNGHQPRIGYRKHDGAALLVHTEASVRRFDIGRGAP